MSGLVESATCRLSYSERLLIVDYFLSGAQGLFLNELGQALMGVGTRPFQLLFGQGVESDMDAIPAFGLCVG